MLRDGHQRWVVAARDATAEDPAAVRDPLARLVARSTDGLPTTSAVPRLLVELRGRVGEPERVHAQVCAERRRIVTDTWPDAPDHLLMLAEQPVITGAGDHASWWSPAQVHVLVLADDRQGRQRVADPLREGVVGGLPRRARDDGHDAARDEEDDEEGHGDDEHGEGLPRTVQQRMTTASFTG
ncbi:hypothetical protein [Nocardioides imazamoxiresistens]|uniref:hypothetical protein n=1 Tax=Nocardioides imazamoxiresistens TaxID=3231893 RepID=UPI0028E9F357|nr:hypothetical protein [Nocardioides zeae]